MTQHQTILLLHKDEEWVCNNTYRANYIFSPHKRRKEIEELTAKSIPLRYYRFEDRPCEHDSKNVRDYKLHTEPLTRKIFRPKFNEDNSVTLFESLEKI